MINLFKNLRIAYSIIYIILIIAFIAAEIYCQFFAVGNLFPFFGYVLLIYIIGISLTTIIFNSIATTKHNQITNELNEFCDPVSFLNKYSLFLQNNTNYRIKLLILLNLSSGYISAGGFAQAKRVLNDIDLHRANNMQLALFYLNLTEIYISENNLIYAERTLNDAKHFIDSKGINRNFKAKVLNCYNNRAAELNMANGHFEGVEQLLNQSFYNSEIMLEKVNSKYLLADFYFKQGRIEEAKSALQFAADNGNTLFIAKKAREQLRLL